MLCCVAVCSCQVVSSRFVSSRVVLYVMYVPRMFVSCRIMCVLYHVCVVFHVVCCMNVMYLLMQTFVRSFVRSLCVCRRPVTHLSHTPHLLLFVQETGTYHEYVCMYVYGVYGVRYGVFGMVFTV